eukprot:506007_1
MGAVCSNQVIVDNCNQNEIHSYVFALPQKNFNVVYEIQEEIGVGTFATVNKCIRKSDSKEFAVKIINKLYLTQKELISLKDEIRILKHTSHTNIIKLIDVFDDGKHVSMVLELCTKTDLFDAIIETQKQKFSETQAAQIIYELSKALHYLHNNGIVHRDLKLDNVLFSLNGSVKLADFGLAYIYDPPPSIKTLNNTQCILDCIRMDSSCGTPDYVAPEVLKQSVQSTYKCDLWSLGVILYIMLVGYKPFIADSLHQVYKLIVKGKYNFNHKKWENISKEAKHLVQCLLEIDPEKRYSAKDIQHHPWIIQHVKKNGSIFGCSK